MAEKILIDFGSSMTNIYKLGSGVVLSEPTVACVTLDGKGDIKAYGLEAKKLIGKTSENSKIVFPIFEGEVVNSDVAISLLSYFFGKIGITSRLAYVEAIFSIPCGLSQEMLDRYKKVGKNAGISKIYFVEAPILSALGQHLQLSESSPCFMINILGGTTDISALTLSGIIAGLSVNFGFNKVTTDIIDYIAEVHGLQIGLLTAERVRAEIASLDEYDGLATVVNGRDIKLGTPKAISIKANELFTPVKKYFEKVCEIAKNVLIKLPPEVSAEIRHSGIYLSGEGASIYGLEKFVSKFFDMKVNISQNPEMDIALGGGIILGNQKLLSELSLKV